MKKWYTNIWWLWFILTSVYLCGSFAGELSHDGDLFGHILGLIGLFVPFGVFTGLFLFSGFGFLIVLIIFGVFALEYHFSQKSHFQDWQKALLALITLLIITMSIDFLIFQSWQSWQIFIDGKIDTSGLN